MASVDSHPHHKYQWIDDPLSDPEESCSESSPLPSPRELLRRPAHRNVTVHVAHPSRPPALGLEESYLDSSSLLSLHELLHRPNDRQSHDSLPRDPRLSIGVVQGTENADCFQTTDAPQSPAHGLPHKQRSPPGRLARTFRASLTPSAAMICGPERDNDNASTGADAALTAPLHSTPGAAPENSTRQGPPVGPIVSFSSAPVARISSFLPSRSAALAAGTELRGRQRRPYWSHRDYIPLSDEDSDDDDKEVLPCPIVPAQRTPPPPVNPQTNEYLVERLLRRRARRHHGGKRKVVSYLVKWDGYGQEHSSWVLKRNISPELVKAFDALCS